MPRCRHGSRGQQPHAPGGIATLATGLALALAKLVLAVATVLVGVTAIDGAIQDTIAARATARSATANDLLLPAIIATPTLLATAAGLAIAKPWGRTKRRRRLSAQPRASAAGRR